MSTKLKTIPLRLSAYLHEAEDTDDWIARTVRFGIISMGNTRDHAVEMIKEAVKITLEDDLSLGIDPNARQDDFMFLISTTEHIHIDVYLEVPSHVTWDPNG